MLGAKEEGESGESVEGVLENEGEREGVFWKGKGGDRS